ncbi:hypothetical protein Aple_001850 [Acrocarpospora pleiomorpha]|uniref:Enoyl-CoA hydratase n=1 Tax=Acrocarpospora pleiomorpha TaxID=90975 RepID=A0A5M3X875_9ACTN|nr:enoyl-CoA hydratase-related protein [Acrocarpospora pleiomorpha]GES17290.1 hypothetical protein Aple_001850 [Acrocarpospora pleiomorpha]
MSDEDYVRAEVEDGIAWVTLNEPRRLNPVTLARIARIQDVVAGLSPRPDVRVIVVTGAGRGFCSGADLRDETLRTAPMFPPASGSLLDSRDGLWNLSAVRQPVIAMVNGPAFGYGYELALQADIRIAGESARFGFPYARMGGVSDTGAATWLLPRQVGYALAAELLFTGRVLSGPEAGAVGLVSRVVPDESLRAVTAELAREIAGGDPAAVQATKRMLVAGRDQSAAEHVLMQFQYANRFRPDLGAAAARLAGGRHKDPK